MTSGRVRGAVSAAAVEWTKLRAQPKTIALLVVCAAASLVFVAAMQIQPAVPSDTLFGRMVHETGFATPLVVLGFAGLWVLPVMAGLAGGDQFSSEDRYATWATLLTRSRSRGEIYAGKILVSFALATLALAVLAGSAIAAGAIVIGAQPLIDLSGVLVPPGAALARVALAWVSVLPPYLAFTAAAILCSIATRSSIGGVGLPVVAGLAMQLAGAFDAPPWMRDLLLTSGFESWHGLFTEPAFIGPFLVRTIVSAVYAIVCLAVAHRIFRRRDVGA